VKTIPELIAESLAELEATVAELRAATERVNTPSLSEEKGMFLVSTIRAARRSAEQAQECALRRERDQTRPTR
jgi:hypothetical protein